MLPINIAELLEKNRIEDKESCFVWSETTFLHVKRIKREGGESLSPSFLSHISMGVESVLDFVGGI